MLTADSYASLPFLQLEAVVFDDRVGQELLAHVFYTFRGVFPTHRIEGDHHKLANPNILHPRKPQRLERPPDRLALWMSRIPLPESCSLPSCQQLTTSCQPSAVNCQQIF